MLWRSIEDKALAWTWKLELQYEPIAHNTLRHGSGLEDGGTHVGLTDDLVCGADELMVHFSFEALLSV